VLSPDERLTQLAEDEPLTDDDIVAMVKQARREMRAERANAS
jgi:hypothetical protein